MNEQLRREPVHERLEQNLLSDGFSGSDVQRLCAAQFESYQLALGQNVAELVDRYQADDILNKAMEIFNAGQSLSPLEREHLFRSIGDVLRRELVGNVNAMSVDCRTKNLLRYRSVIQQWITPQEYQSIISSSIQYYLDIGTLGPLLDCSLYAALYFSELKNELPGGGKFSENILRVIEQMNRWVPLFATTPPESIGSELSLGRDFQRTDEVIEVPGVEAVKRSDIRFTDCVPMADFAHLYTSLSTTRGRNTFVFCQGRLIGSMKHSYDDFGSQKTFLGMRTICHPKSDVDSRKSGTYPVIEGGLYLVADREAFTKIIQSGDRCDIDQLSLMPLRSTVDLTNFSHEQYLERIRTMRSEFEK